MKVLILLFILSFPVWTLQGQKIVTADTSICDRENEIFKKRNDLRVYRTEEADRLLREYQKNGIRPGLYWLGEGNWGRWVLYKTMPDSMVDSLYTCLGKGDYREDCTLLLYYATTGCILTAEYIIKDSVRPHVTDEQLNTLYNNILKMKIMSLPWVVREPLKKYCFWENEFFGRSSKIFCKPLQLIMFSEMVLSLKNDPERWEYVREGFE